MSETPDVVDRLDKFLGVGINREAIAEITRLRADLAEAVEALAEIEKGEGAFSFDRLTHASNCIESMKEKARTILAKHKHGGST